MIRIVKMSFNPDYIETFKQLFDEKKHKIGSFPGCSGVRLLQDKANPGIFFTCSVWDSTDSLETYRNSEFFQETWKLTKKGFNAKPEAWSVEDVNGLGPD